MRCRTANETVMPSLENRQNRNKRKEMWQKCGHKKVILLRSMTHSRALRSLKLYRMHVKIPMLCPHPFCVYICVCLYPGGLLPHQGSGTMDPERISSIWTGVVRKTSYTLFLSSSFSLSLHLFPLYLFISQCIISCLIVLYHSSPIKSFVLPLAKVTTVYYYAQCVSLFYLFNNLLEDQGRGKTEPMDR